MEKYAMLARHCHFADYETDDEQAAELFLQAVAKLMTQCGMDKLVSPVKAEDHAELIRLVVQDSINYSAPITLNNEDIETILKSVTRKE